MPSNLVFARNGEMLSVAEMAKRIVLARELPGEAFPGTTWRDSKNLPYGAGATA